MSAPPAVLSGVFNNNVVQLLKAGSTAAVKQLVGFGCRPEASIGYVVPPNTAERHSFWGWSHAAPVADGVMVWWYWIEQTLKPMDRGPAQKHLSWALGEAMEVAFAAGAVVPFEATWRNLLAHADKKTTPDWTRDLMNLRLLDHIAQVPERSTAFVQAFHRAGLLRAEDCALESRARCTRDPLEQAISGSHADLVAALLAAGSGSRLVNNQEALTAAWALMPRLPATGKLSEGIVRTAHTIAALLEGGADWNVPSMVGERTTVRSEANREHALFARPQLDRLHRAIQARELDATMAPSAAARSGSRRRL